MTSGMLFTGLFVVIGLGMMLYPFRSLAMARRTHCAITDRRILPLTLGHHSRTTSIDPAQIHKVELPRG